MNLQERARQTHAAYQRDRECRIEAERQEQTAYDRALLTETLHRIGIHEFTICVSQPLPSGRMDVFTEVDGVLFSVEHDKELGTIVLARVPCPSAEHTRGEHWTIVEPDDTEESFLNALGAILSEPCFPPAMADKLIPF